ncbi:uncharacterized protein C8A04DRAFT_30314 [Dichotomopilus funicola]|uniref:Uncharacterized protein n=1 Tax=Dichotomopilus funicola TaxID=1934379 RepID=A0AAN6ZKQ7_9PEZI|nr:hypothetical protein C8A04DRAFT_30314 [Dichotomopilus funicola]
MLEAGDCSGSACAVPSGSLLTSGAPAGNAFMLAAFAALFPPVIYAMLRYKTLAYSLFLLAALAVEVVGHVGKVFLVRDPSSHAYTAVCLMGTHWGAVLIGSAMNLVLPHVLVLYGDEFRLVSEPVYLNILFFVLDVFTLAFQSVGIGFASTARTATEVSQGTYILLTGLGIQAVNLLVFLGIYRYFKHKLSHRRYILDDRYSLLYMSRRFKYFMIGVQVVALLLIIRTAVRIAVFADGLTSSFASSPVTTFLLDDTLVLLAALFFTIYPVGRVFGSVWPPTSPTALTVYSPNHGNAHTPTHHASHTSFTLSFPPPPTSPTHGHTDNRLLPLRLRRHRRNRSSRSLNNHKRVISLPTHNHNHLPYNNNNPSSPSASTPRFSPGFTPRGGMTPGLPAHPSPRTRAFYESQGYTQGGYSSNNTTPLTSPRNQPVHQRSMAMPYDLAAASPTQDMPFLSAAGGQGQGQDSSGLDSARWMGYENQPLAFPPPPPPPPPLPPKEYGRKKKGKGGSGSGPENEMVDGDALW